MIPFGLSGHSKSKSNIPMLTCNLHYAIILFNSLVLFLYAWNGKHPHVRAVVGL